MSTSEEREKLLPFSWESEPARAERNEKVKPFP